MIAAPVEGEARVAVGNFLAIRVFLAMVRGWSTPERHTPALDTRILVDEDWPEAVAGARDAKSPVEIKIREYRLMKIRLIKQNSVANGGLRAAHQHLPG